MTRNLLKSSIVGLGVIFTIASFSYGANPPLQVNAKLKATDKDSDSECGGDRHREKQLEMVHFPIVGKRNATEPKMFVVLHASKICEY